ncbi:2-keto-3-deoxy-phosphogluconate aldolase [Microcella alkaliphila]|uniref:2-keto-3-deoxy-phosphogluconate aldolase n=1 Tax=Microcella alkaliphila TaxID=279828 RepID=A0A4Q7TGD1_9MICO|nr:bifunctional 4-hydroxy-2-oxoglutarate aldolase/2-dehydro-3-deoxy-phosphogluconate aldolase [Microcella alkaliphila]RZT59535.1 2-keto-3-deoxy-phosphogluconate aldolase [Microcella alkaliphila]
MSDSTPSPALDSVHTTGVFAVVRAPDPDAALHAADALIRGGVTGIEVTYSTPEAASVIAELHRRHGDAALIGAGTVTTAALADESAAAGARFLVSPGTLPDVARAMLDTGLITMTGALTPTELMSALALGVHVVKVFPASFGGVPHIKALREPFPEAALMPTGGVTAENLGQFFAAGVIAVGAGGDLIARDALAERDWDRIETRAREYAAALASTRVA